MIIDTNAVSDWADGTGAAPGIISQCPRRVIPVTVLGEYQFGIKASRYRARYEHWLAQTLPHCEIHPSTQATAGIYSQLRHDLKKAGQDSPPERPVDCSQCHRAGPAHPQ